MSSHMSSQSIDSTSTRSAWVPPLLWKEFRQVVPLMTAVLIGGFGLLLMILVLSALTSKRSFSFNRSYWYLFLSMPMMYATGVGVLLVGIEKESRSLQWMRSLPISSKQIAWNKLVVAMGTLALVWLIALTAWCAFASAVGGDPRAIGSIDPGQSDMAGWQLVTYFLMSLFLSLAGLAFAWRFQSQFLALALLVPAALAFWLPAYGLANYLSNKNYSAALEPPVGTSGVISLVQDASASERRSSEAWMLWPRVSPISGMLWQIVKQNGIWWIAYASVGIVLLVLYSRSSLLNRSSNLSETLLGFLYIPMAILSGWLGILAYHSDGIQQRVRFYADRGVSPRDYWCTRHWIPVTLMLGLCLVGIAVCQKPHNCGNQCANGALGHVRLLPLCNRRDGVAMVVAHCDVRDFSDLDALDDAALDGTANRLEVLLATQRVSLRCPDDPACTGLVENLEHAQDIHGIASNAESTRDCQSSHANESHPAELRDRS